MSSEKRQIDKRSLKEILFNPSPEFRASVEETLARFNEGLPMASDGDYLSSRCEPVIPDYALNESSPSYKLTN